MRTPRPTPARRGFRSREPAPAGRASRWSKTSTRSTGSNWLVQRYLARPHLLDGRKYTLRRYVLVTALDPLTVWVFGDGFAKLASRPYSLRADERGDRFRHLTNPDVQAENPEVATSADNLTFGAYAERLQAAGTDAAALFARVDRVVAAAIGSARDELARSTWRATNNPGGCFELLGLDILIDEDMRPWLLECNVNPSLSVEADDEPDGETRSSREERELKSALVRDLCRVVGLLDVAPGEPSFRRLLPDERLAALLPLPRPGEGGVPRELRPAEGVTAEPVGGALVLYEPATSRAHVLDSVASYLWVAWAEGLSVDEIAAELTEALPEAAWRAEADVRNALAEWFELGLAVDGRRARVEPRPAAAPRLRWNRERIYRCLDTVLAVTSPNDELEGWLDVSLGPLADEPAEQVDVYVEVVPSRTGWEVVGAGERQPVRSPRQLGPVVRSLLLRRAAGLGAFAATLLADDDGHGLVLVGPAPLRAALTRGWLRDGGRCAGDDLVCLQPAASARGHAIGFEEPAGPTWWGDLPALADERPLLVSTGGTFAQMWWPLAGGDGGATIDRPVFLRVDQPALPGALLAAAPLLPEDAFRDLIVARFADGPLSLETVQHAARLVQAVPCFSVLVPDASVGRDCCRPCRHCGSFAASAAYYLRSYHVDESNLFERPLSRRQRLLMKVAVYSPPLIPSARRALHRRRYRGRSDRDERSAVRDLSLDGFLVASSSAGPGSCSSPLEALQRILRCSPAFRSAATTRRTARARRRSRTSPMPPTRVAGRTAASP